MDRREARPSQDALLLPFLQAKEAAESDRLLAQLLLEHADPRIRQILRRKRHLYQDSEDVYSEARVQLLARLSELKANPDAQPIINFHSYVAVVAYNACHEYLRRKYPKRHSLKNQVRYRLEHHPSLACWEGPEKERLCGFAVWRDQKKRVFDISRGDHHI